MSEQDVPYAELEVTSNFSFLRGASHPEELAARAAELGHAAAAIADRATLAGVVRAHGAAKAAGLRLLTGCRLMPEDGPGLIVYPRDRAAYGRLSRVLTLGKRRAGKGECRLTLADLAGLGGAQIVDIPGFEPLTFVNPGVLSSHDRQQPSLDDSFVFEATQGFEGPEHCLLNNVIGQTRVPTEPKGIPVEIVAPRRYETLESQRYGVAGTGFRHETRPGDYGRYYSPISGCGVL